MNVRVFFACFVMRETVFRRGIGDPLVSCIVVLYCYIEGQIAFLSLWLQLQKRSLYTVYQCGNVTLDFHYAPSDFTGKTCSIGTLSMESSSVSDTVLNFCLEPTNINSVFVVFKVILEEKGHLPNFPILQ